MADEGADSIPVLAIYDLHLRNHLAREFTDSYAVSAAVCMSRHHVPPMVWSVRLDARDSVDHLVEWEPPTPEHIRSCGNHDEATRDGAYGLALAASDVHLDLVALGRAEGRTGADFYLVPADAVDEGSLHFNLQPENRIRLEVSGIDRDDEAIMNARLNQKVRQAREGRSDLPALAVVVGFTTARVIFRTAVS
jgi:hypothetical protein